jgi:heat-inducible transcriptional repressor
VNPIKSFNVKKTKKHEREQQVLLGLVEYYLKTNKPVGSNSLKEAGFGDLSSATIRNYFARLEQEGYLSQQHVSGGRIPTHKAYRFYANEYLDVQSHMPPTGTAFTELANADTHEIVSYLQKSAETLSNILNCAVFLSSPRFDHDVVVALKLLPIDHSRCLCVIVTDFGMIQTHLHPINAKLTSFTVKRLESYFHWRLTGNDKPEDLDTAEERFAQTLYNELMVRYIVGYSNFTNEEVYQTGFSKLLNYSEFHDPLALSNSLALFENTHGVRLLLKECSKLNRLKFWIGDDLAPFTNEVSNCAVIAIPYYINQQPVGAIGALGPTRIPYRELFGLMRAFSCSISSALTKNIYKFKIQFRQPQEDTRYIHSEKHHLLGHSCLMLLEDKR